MVFDITDVDSFQKAKKWIKELQKMISASLSLTLVGNKMDLEKNRQIKYEEGKEYVSSHTSSRDGVYVLCVVSVGMQVQLEQST